MAQPWRKKTHSVRCFEASVCLLPAEFRKLHGSQMIETFRDSWRDLARDADCITAARFWLRTLSDLASAAVILRVERFIMSKTSEPAHLALLIRPWAFLQRLSDYRHWLARFEPYPKPFQKALQFAWYEAKAYSSPEIMPEHILLGLMRATKAIRGHAASNAIQSSVAAIDAYVGHGRGRGAAQAPRDPIVNRSSQHVIARALETAAFRRQRLSPLHLLLSLCEEHSGVVSECVDTLSLDRLWLENQL